MGSKPARTVEYLEHEVGNGIVKYEVENGIVKGT